MKGRGGMPGDIALEIRGLSKKFGSFQAVKQVDLEVGRGEIFGFLGPNGAGKTTTIRMLTGLLEPSAGDALISGYSMWKKPLEAKKRMAFVPDQPILYPKLTGREYLRFVGSVFQMEERIFSKRMEEYLSLFQLESKADSLIESYSHGMKQKISICAALLHKPDILFLDEPTVGLDPKGARTLKTLLETLCRQGMTVFMSTHILQIAEQMCSRVGIIKNGEIIALGTMEELRPAQGKEGTSLEDLFLELTGDSDIIPLIKSLSEQNERGREL
jgi:ABC-2 type transport system ATP-binding protein